nr:Hypothetical protein [Providencia alcalifaciens]
MCKLSSGKDVTCLGESFLSTNNGINADMKVSCSITNIGIIHRKVDNFIFGTGVAGTIFIIELEASTAVLAAVTLMTCTP